MDAKGGTGKGGPAQPVDLGKVAKGMLQFWNIFSHGGGEPLQSVLGSSPGLGISSLFPGLMCTSL